MPANRQLPRRGRQAGVTRTYLPVPGVGVCHLGHVCQQVQKRHVAANQVIALNVRKSQRGAASAGYPDVPYDGVFLTSG